MKTQFIPMPATVLIQALQWWKAKRKQEPKTLENMLRVKDLYIERASFLN